MVERTDCITTIFFCISKSLRAYTQTKFHFITNLDDLKKLIEDDIIGNINRNLEMGNITRGDAHRLGNLCHLLYRHLYEHLEGMGEVTAMTDESLIFDIDIIEKQVEELQAEIEKKDAEIGKKDAEIGKKDIEIKKKDAEIEELKRLLAEKSK